MKHIGIFEDKADVVLTEILCDKDSEWYAPIAQSHKIFEQAYMKFLNRNLNYFDFYNMLACVLEGDQINPAFTNTLMWCNEIRALSTVRGPFGRMCVWRLPPGKHLQPHKDAFRYHFHIVRNIFVVKSSPQTKIFINMEEVPHVNGTLFQFSPATEVHSFANDGDADFFFLGFDFWDAKMLNVSFDRTKVAETLNNTERYTGYGAFDTNKKYMSRH
jgi:hypothetical protein